MAVFTDPKARMFLLYLEILEQQFSNWSCVRISWRAFEHSDHWAPPQHFWFRRFGIGSWILIFYKFPGAAAAGAGLETTG